ncbi:hypothetical protein PHYBOEH_006013 [Phytophthora boehmeriae]|uniref:Uncharacterized protein n=1 Tax=Phytophthora boehmeriae TaxID=109152 RepID=A0A8T1WIS4_9STRA|nr:hypothetical protein PHYBOEH_006013 [Phytophthora boehmeriae]
MCVLVGVPTVLIDTQARIVLLGTQTNSFLATGTFAMVIAEVFLRAGKSAFVVWTINQRGVAVDKAVKELVQPPALIVKKHSSHGPPSSSSPSSVSLRMEFEQWRRQVLSYHTAEITADMYAEYIAIGCSQSIVFWYVGHPYYPALQLTRTGIAKWRLNQLAMLFFQFAVEIVVDYVCVVLEMAAGIEFDRIKGLSGFLGVFFMTMAVLNINISVSVYLSWGSHQDNH